MASVEGFPLFFPFFPCPCVRLSAVVLVLALETGGGESGLRQARPLAQLTVAWSICTTAANAGVTLA